MVKNIRSQILGKRIFSQTTRHRHHISQPLNLAKVAMQNPKPHFFFKSTYVTNIERLEK